MFVRSTPNVPIHTTGQPVHFFSRWLRITEMALFFIMFIMIVMPPSARCTICGSGIVSCRYVWWTNLSLHILTIRENGNIAAYFLSAQQTTKHRTSPIFEWIFVSELRRACWMLDVWMCCVVCPWIFVSDLLRVRWMCGCVVWYGSLMRSKCRRELSDLLLADDWQIQMKFKLIALWRSCRFRWTVNFSVFRWHFHQWPISGASQPSYQNAEQVLDSLDRRDWKFLADCWLLTDLI